MSNTNTPRAPKLRSVPRLPESDAPLPHDETRECALLSAILSNAKSLDHVIDLVTPKDFYDPARAIIFDAMLQIRATGEQPSRAALVSWLNDRGTLAHAGGPMAIARLAYEVPVIGQVVEHARHIALKARVRAFSLESRALSEEAKGDIGNAAEWLDKATKQLRKHADGLIPTNAISLRNSLSEFFQQLNHDIDRRGQISGYSTGLRELDELTAGWHGGDITLIGGATGFGKSAFAGCQAINVASVPQMEVAMYNGAYVDCEVPIGVVIFSLEMRHKKLSQRLCCGLARVNYQDIRTGNGTSADMQKLVGASEMISHLPIFIDDDPMLTMSRFEAKVARIEGWFAAMGVRLGLVLLDYMQLVDVRGEGDDKSNREIQFNLAGRRLQMFASTFKAQPRALPKINGVRVDAGKLDPSLVAFGVLVQLNDEGHVRESKALLQHAHGFWVLEPTSEEPQGPGRTRRAKIRIKKQREGDSNVSATCWHHSAYTLFSDAER